MDKIQLTPKITGERIKEYLATKGKRFDGRNPDEFREIIVETGISKKAEGSARVKVGKTEVVVGVKMDISEPYPDSPNAGNLMVTAELLPLSSPRFESGPPKFPAIELARIVDRAIRESKFIDLKKLCVKEGEKVWNIFIDIYSINDDGNLLDAAGIGAVVALNDAKIPKYDEKEERVVYGEWTNKKIPFTKNIPLPITSYKVGDVFVVDPTLEEEDISETRITLGYSDGTISAIQKGNSKSITTGDLEKVVDLSEKVWKDIFKKIRKFVE